MLSIKNKNCLLYWNDIFITHTHSLQKKVRMFLIKTFLNKKKKFLIEFLIIAFFLTLFFSIYKNDLTATVIWIFTVMFVIWFTISSICDTHIWMQKHNTGIVEKDNINVQLLIKNLNLSEYYLLKFYFKNMKINFENGFETKNIFFLKRNLNQYFFKRKKKDFTLKEILEEETLMEQESDIFYCLGFEYKTLSAMNLARNNSLTKIL